MSKDELDKLRLTLIAMGISVPSPKIEGSGNWNLPEHQQMTPQEKRERCGCGQVAYCPDLLTCKSEPRAHLIGARVWLRRNREQHS